MPLFEWDVNDESPWDAGLARLVVDSAVVSVVVDGLDAPVMGTLAGVGKDGWLVVDQQKDEGGDGTVQLVPVDRVVSVAAPYRL